MNMVAEPLPADDASAHGGVSMDARRKVFRIFFVAYGLHMSSVMVVKDAKMMAYLRHYKGDTARYAANTSRAMVNLKASSLVAAPLLAVYSEAHGRRPLLMLGAIWALFLRCADLAWPIPAVLFMTTSLSSLAHATIQGTMTAIGDLYPSDPKGAGGSIALLQSGTMIVKVVTPTLSAVLASVSMRLPMALSVSIACLEVGLLSLVPESLPLDKRLPLANADWKRTNPLAFSRIFFQNRRLSALALTQLLVHVCDPMMISLTAALVHRESLGWGLVQCGRYTSVSSAIEIPALVYAGRILETFGSAPSLALSGACGFLHALLEAIWVGNPWQQYAILPLIAARGVNTAALNALLLQAGQDAGMRQGELRGALQGLQHVAGILASPLWAWWFARCLREGRSRRFFAGSATVALLQLLVGQLSLVLPSKSQIAVADNK